MIKNSQKVEREEKLPQPDKGLLSLLTVKY